MKRILSALTLSAVLASPAWSAQMRGLSFMECDLLNNYHTTETKDWSAVKQWIYGYMSGINAVYEAFEFPEPFSQLHFDASYRFVKRHCESNPEGTIMTSVIAFNKEVMEGSN